MEKPASLSKVLLWGALVAIGFAPLLYRFGGEQWAVPHYQFYPLLLIAAGFIAWQRIHEIPGDLRMRGSALVTHLLLAAAALVLIGSAIIWSGRMAAGGACIVLAALAWHAGGRAMVRALVPAGVLVALIVGPPVGMGETLLQRLREVAVWASSHVLVWLGVIHMETGTIIEIKSQRLLVSEACSGINSMMAVLSFTLVLAFLRRRSVPHTLGLIGMAVIYVLWANTARIAGGVWLKVNNDVDILAGAGHEGASIILFAVCMTLVMSTDVLIRLVRPYLRRHRIRRRSNSQPEVSVVWVQAPFPSFVLTRGMWVGAAVFALVGFAQIGNASVNGGLGAWIRGSGSPTIKPDAFFELPPKIAGWERAVDAEELLAPPEIEGKRSQSWAYRNGGNTVILAIDYPFMGYHDLTLCYRNAGWQVKQLLRENDAQGNGFASADLMRLSERGYFWYSVLNERGEWVQPPRRDAIGRILDRLEHTGPPTWSAPVYQVQVWVQRYEDLSDQQQKQVQDLFLAARQQLAQQVLTQLGGAQ